VPYILVTSSLSMISSLRLDCLGRLCSLLRRSCRRFSSSGSSSLLGLSRTDVSELRLGRRSRCLFTSGGSAKISSWPGGPRGFKPSRLRSSSDGFGRCPGGGILPNGLGAIFSARRPVPFMYGGGCSR